MPPGVLAEHGEWMLEMRMLRAETPADGISAAGKYWTSASPGSFYIRAYPTPSTRNGPDVASWQILLQKSFCEVGLKFSGPQVQRLKMMWRTTSPSAKLTGDSGSGFEALLIGDCRLFCSLAEN
jgi:hypothetical protein